ncbi:MAG: hypothetical protein IGS48_18515 [Oscillatoriales cyanobacterium C42_A2020_001]|nr:hypothetical protein [Leptolyngbyaceae cyanobacterium C42_A2020_001]
MRKLSDRTLFTQTATASSTVLLAFLLQNCAISPEAQTNTTPTNSQPTSPPMAEVVQAATPVATGQRTYHIGNSLTDSLNDSLAKIAQSAGYQHDYLRSTIPGAPTDWNWDHPGQALGEPDYRTVFETKAPLDHLFIQPFAGHGRSLENETDYSGRFYRLARQKSPNVQLWVYAQWAAQSLDDPWAKAKDSAAGLGLQPAKNWEEAVRNHLVYHEAVRQRLDDQNEGKPVLIVPGGSALIRLKQEIEAGKVPGMNNFFATQFEDDLHLNPKGKYLISLVHYACIYRRDPTGVTVANTGLTTEQAAIYQRIAWETVRNYQWTGLGSKK